MVGGEVECVLLTVEILGSRSEGGGRHTRDRRRCDVMSDESWKKRGDRGQEWEDQPRNEDAVEG